MKRIWAAVILAAISLTICIIGLRHTQDVTAQMAQTVTMAKKAEERGDSAAAYTLSLKASQDWKNAHQALCTYMIHSQLEEIDQTLALLPALCKEGADDSFLSECDRGLVQISYLNESEIPNLQNIL